MKKITFLLLGLLMVCGSASAKITKTPLIISGVPLTGEKSVSMSTWADFRFNNKVVSIADYPKVKFSYGDASGKFYVYVVSQSKVKQAIGILKDSADVDTTIVFNDQQFTALDSIYVDMQCQNAGKIHVKDITFIAADGTEMHPTYGTGGWGCTIGSLSGISTMGQWGRMGGASWVPTKYVAGETHDFTIKLNEPVPNGKWYFVYKKTGATVETYVRIPEGALEYTLSLNFDYGTYMNIQSQLASNKLNVASITRTVYAPVHIDSISLYSDEYGTDMGEWFDRVTIPAEKFVNAKIYDIIATKISNSTATSTIGFRENTADRLPLDSKVGETALTETTTAFNYTIMADSVLAKLKKNGLIISGSSYTLKSADLITTDDSYDPNATPSAISTINKNGAEVVETQIYNVAGQQTSTLMKGINIIRQHMSNGSTKVLKVLTK